MHGTATSSATRSVQLAVLAAPATSVIEAVAEARRRNQTADRRVAAASEVSGVRRMAAASA